MLTWRCPARRGLKRTPSRPHAAMSLPHLEIGLGWRRRQRARRRGRGFFKPARDRRHMATYRGRADEAPLGEAQHRRHTPAGARVVGDRRRSLARGRAEVHARVTARRGLSSRPANADRRNDTVVMPESIAGITRLGQCRHGSRTLVRTSDLVGGVRQPSTPVKRGATASRPQVRPPPLHYLQADAEDLVGFFGRRPATRFRESGRQSGRQRPIRDFRKPQQQA